MPRNRNMPSIMKIWHNRWYCCHELLWIIRKCFSIIHTEYWLKKMVFFVILIMSKLILWWRQENLPGYWHAENVIYLFFLDLEVVKVHGCDGFLYAAKYCLHISSCIPVVDIKSMLFHFFTEANNFSKVGLFYFVFVNTDIFYKQPDCDFMK